MTAKQVDAILGLNRYGISSTFFTAGCALKRNYYEGLGVTVTYYCDFHVENEFCVDRVSFQPLFEAR